MKIVSIIVSIVLVLLILAFGFSCVGNSAARIRREHGLELPASADHFVCRGDAWMQIMDRGAASAFEMDAKDLKTFTAQLMIEKTDDWPQYGSRIFPGNPQYQIQRPWMSGRATIAYHCKSSTGDWLEVQIWQMSSNRVGICLYTDWN
jgi:hypothetical protein